MTTEEFFDISPRTFFVLLNVHLDIEKAKAEAFSPKKKAKRPESGFIDQIPGF